MSQEISIRPIVSGYRCFKLKDVSEESLNKLIGWAKDKLDIDIEVSLTTDNKLYRSKSQNQVVANHTTIKLELRQNGYHRSEIVVEDNEPIYCVYAWSYLCFYSYSDFHKEFSEEENNSKTGLTFEQALTLLKSGKEVRRSVWATDSKLKHTYLSGCGGYIPVIYLHSPVFIDTDQGHSLDDYPIEWKPQQTDLFANDWLEL